MSVGMSNGFPTGISIRKKPTFADIAIIVCRALRDVVNSRVGTKVNDLTQGKLALFTSTQVATTKSGSDSTLYPTCLVAIIESTDLWQRLKKIGHWSLKRESTM